jgi:hypothetical protein
MIAAAAKLPVRWGSLAFGAFLTAVIGGNIVAALLYGRVGFIATASFADQPFRFVLVVTVLGLMLASGLTCLWDGIAGLVHRNHRGAAAVS